MSRQYDELIRLLKNDQINVDELVARNQGRTRSDLIGENDVA